MRLKILYLPQSRTSRFVSVLGRPFWLHACKPSTLTKRLVRDCTYPCSRYSRAQWGRFHCQVFGEVRLCRNHSTNQINKHLMTFLLRCSNIPRDITLLRLKRALLWTKKRKKRPWSSSPEVSQVRRPQHHLQQQSRSEHRDCR